MEKNLDYYIDLYQKISELIAVKGKRKFTEEEIKLITDTAMDVYSNDKYKEDLVREASSNLIYLRNAVKSRIRDLEEEKLEYWENNDSGFVGDDSAIRYAVEWWGNAVISPTFNNSDNSIQSLMASSMMNNFYQEKQAQVSELEVKQFMRRLYYILGLTLARGDMDYIPLTTEYQPTGLFEADIAMRRWTEQFTFPWKVQMRVTADEVWLKMAGDDELKKVFDAKKAYKHL